MTVADGADAAAASTAQPICTPGIGLPKASVTCTTSGLASAAPAGADWLSPATARSSLASAETALKAERRRQHSLAVGDRHPHLGRGRTHAVCPARPRSSA